MKRASTLLLLLFTVLNIGLSQSTLDGIVKDQATSKPISFANIALYQSGEFISGVTSDEYGRFLFSGLEIGVYHIEVKHLEYSIYNQERFKISSGENTLDILLLANTSIEEVVISADKIEHKRVSTAFSSAMATPSMISGIAPSGKSEIRNYPLLPATSSTEKYEIDLPESGQMTAGEWNDLHNWQDWMNLLENEDYGIMTERFEIFPLYRYSVLVINQDNNVLPNIPVTLIDTDGKEIWSTITDNAGKAELWLNAFSKGQEAFHIMVGSKKVTNITSIDEGSNTVVINQTCNTPSQMDIVFTVDATSSMKDEISFLKSELLDVINRVKSTNDDIDFKLGSVFYRDVSDDYLTRISPLSANADKVVEFIEMQDAQGGGDKPEAVEEALDKTLSLDWRDDALKIVFLVLDAPPHEDEQTMHKIRIQIETAAAKGIKLIPITASGIDRNTEFLMKFMAMMTNGTYVFITDDSGIGNPHLAPVVEDYKVEKLNDCMVRLISQYAESYSCDVSFDNDVSLSVFPNPSTQFINVKSSTIPDKINILTANGMLIKTIKPTENQTRIELADLVNGVYNVVIYIGERVETRQIILLK